MSSQSDFLSSVETWVNMYLFRSLTEFMNYLRVAGLSMQQAYALTYIFYSGPSRMSDLCEHMIVSAAAASQMVNRLEKQNLVKRIVEPGDRRVRNVVLTEAGVDFVKQGISARQSWMAEIPAELSEQQQRQISEALQLMISAFQGKATP